MSIAYHEIVEKCSISYAHKYVQTELLRQLIATLHNYSVIVWHLSQTVIEYIKVISYS